ncbi:hypothetical protein FNV43_RR27249 [Rhamnella rubrinervis]|uniref:Uncharacterized protein n=1 Tax=Rhamnella rubrinervis TaxID=2594499 RepID=A0A8K0DQP2_9ROSA|nr:hypothetical protein FNV43_RR27249 [Rhamnella rubrinervis]
MKSQRWQSSASIVDYLIHVGSLWDAIAHALPSIFGRRHRRHQQGTVSTLSCILHVDSLGFSKLGIMATEKIITSGKLVSSGPSHSSLLARASSELGSLGHEKTMICGFEASLVPKDTLNSGNIHKIPRKSNAAATSSSVLPTASVIRKKGPSFVAVLNGNCIPAPVTNDNQNVPTRKENFISVRVNDAVYKERLGKISQPKLGILVPSNSIRSCERWITLMVKPSDKDKDEFKLNILGSKITTLAVVATEAIAMDSDADHSVQEITVGNSIQNVFSDLADTFEDLDDELQPVEGKTI